MTIQERLIVALETRGSKKVKVMTGCVVYTHPRLPDVFLFVGKMGSLRRGTLRGNAIPVEGLKTKLLAGEGILR